MAGRVTQVAVEAVIASTSGSARVTQAAVEAVIAPTDAAARVTQVAVEAVISPTSQNLSIAQAGLVTAWSGESDLSIAQAGFEVLLLPDDRNISIFQAGIQVAFEVPKGTFTVDARLVYDDGYPDRRSNWTTVDAWLKKNQVTSFAADAVVKKTISGAAQSFLVEASKSARFFVDAQVGYWFRAEAEIAPLHSWLDATILAHIAASTTANATILAHITPTPYLARAVKKETFVFEPGTTVEAWLAGRFFVYSYVNWWFAVNAIQKVTVEVKDEEGVPINAFLAGHFEVDAWIQLYFWVDADIQFGFDLYAVIKRTMGVPSMLPLSYPGTSKTLYGQTANALTPLFPVDLDQQITVQVITPPSDGGDLGAFNVTAILNYGITASPGTYTFPVLPGLYYIFSSKDNVYRPGLSGSGYYSDWGISYLTFSVDSFVELVFRVDAALVWHWEFDWVIAAAWKKATITSSTKADAWIQPYFFVDAEMVPMRFRADAWIKCEFILQAWLIRRVTGSLTANAFIKGYFRVDAIKRKTTTTALIAYGWISNPVYGIFEVDAQVGYYFTAGASIRLTKYRKFTAAATIKRTFPASLAADAYVKPYFRVDAWFFRREFFLYATRRATFTFEDATGVPVNANFVWTFVSPRDAWLPLLTLDAFIQPYFRVSAVRHEQISSSFAVSSWFIRKVYGSFTIQAAYTGFRVFATIKGPQQLLFRVHAYKGFYTPQLTFLAQAEKRRPGAYWDPINEVWVDPNFSADAFIEQVREKTMTVGSYIAIPGVSQHSLALDAYVFRTSLTGEFLLESEISSLRTVVYEGAGETELWRHQVTYPLAFPGEPAPVGGLGNLADPNYNHLYGPFPIIDLYPVQVGIYDAPGYDGYIPGVTQQPSVGLHSRSQNMWFWPTAGSSTTFWPNYEGQDYYVYLWHDYGNYDPTVTGSGWVSYYRDDTVTLSLPAPTIDAWLVGTIAEPVTVDAEIVSPEKIRHFTAAAELFEGDVLGQISLDAISAGSRAFFFNVGSTFAEAGFTLDAAFYQPHATADAFIQPYLTVNATKLNHHTVSPGPRIDAVLTRITGTGSFTAGADINEPGDVRGSVALDSVVLGPRINPRRIYLAAYVVYPPSSFVIEAYVALHVAIEAWVASSGGGLGGFSANAYVRGGNYVIYPAQQEGWDGTGSAGNTFSSPSASFSASNIGSTIIIAGTSYVIVSVIDPNTITVSPATVPSASGLYWFLPPGAPVGPDGGPPPLARKFKIRIEAGIPEPIPLTNDAEIQRLIDQIEEAERELESLYCAVEHYSTQGPTSRVYSSINPNQLGTGYNKGVLPKALSQIGYPGAGDIDDCWVVATVWAALASGETFKPTVTQFRTWARNPDKPGPTGGTLDHIMRGARAAWPNHTIKRYQSTNWDGFVSLLKAGWIASLAVRSSGLPSDLRYNFQGLHQIGVAYENGQYWVMNPLMSNNASLKSISGLELRRAARGFVGGTISACLFA